MRLLFVRLDDDDAMAIMTTATWLRLSPHPCTTIWTYRPIHHDMATGRHLYGWSRHAHSDTRGPFQSDSRAPSSTWRWRGSWTMAFEISCSWLRYWILTWQSTVPSAMAANMTSRMANGRIDNCVQNLMPMALVLDINMTINCTIGNGGEYDFQDGKW